MFLGSSLSLVQAIPFILLPNEAISYSFTDSGIGIGRSYCHNKESNIVIVLKNQNDSL